MAEKLAMICDKEQICGISSYQCKTEMPTKYVNMLDKQSARTHYLHIERPADDLQGVLLFWGLTDEESLQICNTMLQKMSASQGEPVTIQCI